MKKRVLTALVLIIVLLPLIVIDSQITKIGYALVTCLFSSVGGYEIVRAVEKESPELKKYKVLIPIFCFIQTGLCLLATYKTSESIVSFKDNSIYHLMALLFFILSASVVFGAMIFTKNSQARGIMGCLLGLTYSGLMLGYTFSLRYFVPVVINDHSNYIHLNSFKCFAYLFSVVIATDTFAYIMGCKFGKKKLCPSISPKKSIIGSLYGLLFGSIFGTITAFALKIVLPSGTLGIIISILGLLVISGFVSVVVQLGDLVESKLKRSFDVKDFGNIFPGHGGVLDRFDSLIYSGMLLYIIIQIAQIILIL